MNINTGKTPDGVTTITAQEFGGINHVTVLTLTDFVIGALDGAAANKAIGSKIYTLPAGVQIYECTFYSLSHKATGTAVTTKTGVGSVVATGAVAVLNGTATFQNYIAENNVATSSSGGTVVPVLQTVTVGPLAGISLQTASQVKDLFLNAAGAWNANNTGNLTTSGTIVLRWTTISQ